MMIPPEYTEFAEFLVFKRHQQEFRQYQQSKLALSQSAGMSGFAMPQHSFVGDGAPSSVLFRPQLTSANLTAYSGMSALSPLHTTLQSQPQLQSQLQHQYQHHTQPPPQPQVQAPQTHVQVQSRAQFVSPLATPAVSLPLTAPPKEPASSQSSVFPQRPQAPQQPLVLPQVLPLGVQLPLLKPQSVQRLDVSSFLTTAITPPRQPVPSSASMGMNLSSLYNTPPLGVEPTTPRNVVKFEQASATSSQLHVHAGGGPRPSSCVSTAAPSVPAPKPAVPTPAHAASIAQSHPANDIAPEHDRTLSLKRKSPPPAAQVAEKVAKPNHDSFVQRTETGLPASLSVQQPSKNPIVFPHPVSEESVPPSVDSSGAVSHDANDEQTHIIITRSQPSQHIVSYLTDDEKAPSDGSTEDEDDDEDDDASQSGVSLSPEERAQRRLSRKNEASKRSREKKKMQQQQQAQNNARYEERNRMLKEKLASLRMALQELRPQICLSCNQQVQDFLDKCEESKDSMNVFILRPCAQTSCRGSRHISNEFSKVEKHSPPPKSNL